MKLNATTRLQATAPTILEKKMAQLKKQGGRILEDVELVNRDGQTGFVGKNGKFTFFVYPDGKIETRHGLQDFIARNGWTLKKGGKSYGQKSSKPKPVLR